MTKSKCSLDLYTKFLIAHHNRYSGVELSKTSEVSLSHDSVSKWLREKDFNEADLKKSGARKMKRAKSIFLWWGERSEQRRGWLP